MPIEPHLIFRDRRGLCRFDAGSFGIASEQSVGGQFNDLRARLFGVAATNSEDCPPSPAGS